jgi:hypothetical protein
LLTRELRAGEVQDNKIEKYKIIVCEYVGWCEFGEASASMEQ